MNPPKKTTLIIACIVAVVGLVLAFVMKGSPIGAILNFLAVALLVAACYLKGL